MSDVISVQIGATRVELANAGLLETSAPAIMLSANNKLEASPTRWSWPQEVEKRAGPAYRDECAWLSRSAGLRGLTAGCAVVTGAGDLSRAGWLRWIIQSVTIQYDKSGQRVLATPEIVYRAVRAGLEKAEIYRIGGVATYVMAVRPDYATASPAEMADALFRAVFDHAGVSSSVELVSICETDPANYQLAQRTFYKMTGNRSRFQS